MTMESPRPRACTRGPALDIRGLAKSYGSNQILRQVDFDLRFGEIHALLGENGAGKSTLIKILAGVVDRDVGDIYVDGDLLPCPHRPEAILSMGVAFVHQHLGLFEDLSVAENIALIAGYARRGGLISHSHTERRAYEWLQSIGASVSPASIVSTLTQDEKVLCAIARAISTNARIIVLDEISASLPAPEMDRLAKMLIAAKSGGVAYIYVTHRLPEVFQLADRVTVLRDGKVSISTEVANTTQNEIVRCILGRQLTHDLRSGGQQASAEPRLQVRDLTGPGLNAPISFDIGPGEVLGICGLVGSGARAVARIIGGATAPTSGMALLDGEPLPLGNAKALARIGCAYVPGDRGAEGALANLTIRENLFPTIRPNEGASETVLRWPKIERGHSSDLVARFEVRPNGRPELAMGALSGGNQQKVVFARALRTPRSLLVLEDPTAGVDIGSRAALYGLMRDAAKAGTAVLMISTDFEEVAAQADRALVMNDGRMVQEVALAGLDASQGEAALAHASYGAPQVNHSWNIEHVV